MLFSVCLSIWLVVCFFFGLIIEMIDVVFNNNDNCNKKLKCWTLFFHFCLFIFANGIFSKVKYIEVVNCMHFQSHPDKLDESLTQEDRNKAYEKFLAIDQAWKLLNDQDTRAKCDRQLKGKQKSYFIYTLVCALCSVAFLAGKFTPQIVKVNHQTVTKHTGVVIMFKLLKPIQGSQIEG